PAGRSPTCSYAPTSARPSSRRCSTCSTNNLGTVSDETLVRERIDKLLANADPKGDPHVFWGEQFDLGLAWVHFPEGYGGLGLSPKLQEPVERALRKASAPSNFARNPIGLGMGAPVVLTHGSEEQKQRYLRPNFTCEEIWC